MRYFALAVVACLLTAAPAGAQTPDPQVMAPIQKFIDSFNKGDIAGAAATHATTAEVAIIDEIPPFAWHGAKAFQAWSTALDADAKRQGITESKVTLGKPTRIESSGDAAYVVVPAVYTFKQKDIGMREAAQMTFVLKKGPGGWLIHGWSWAGPKPQPTGKQ